WERWEVGSAPSDRSLDRLSGTAAVASAAGERVLMLSDDPVGCMRGSYLLYPRRVDVVQRVDGFTAADLDPHAGGCLLTYGPQTHSLYPFRARLSMLGSS